MAPEMGGEEIKSVSVFYVVDPDELVLNLVDFAKNFAGGIIIRRRQVSPIRNLLLPS